MRMKYVISLWQLLDVWVPDEPLPFNPASTSSYETELFIALVGMIVCFSIAIIIVIYMILKSRKQKKLAKTSSLEREPTKGL